MNAICIPKSEGTLASFTLFTSPGVKADSQDGFPTVVWNFLAFCGFKSPGVIVLDNLYFTVT